MKRIKKRLKLPSKRWLDLYDTVADKRTRKWYRVTDIGEGRIELKEVNDGVSQNGKGKRCKVTPEELEQRFAIQRFPKVKTYIDKSLIEKTPREEQEEARSGAKEAYAVRRDGVERMKRRHKK